MTDNHLDVSIRDDVAVIRLNRPAKLNALDVTTRVLLAENIRRFGTGELVRGIVLTGTGRAFSAGEDLQTLPTTYDELRSAVTTFNDITRAILETAIPVIAAVNGIAVGGASEVTLACDSRIGCPATQYFQPENHRGIIISNASSLLMTRLVRNHAMRIIMGSIRIDADEAMRIGLLDEITTPETLVHRAVAVARDWNCDARITALHLRLLRPRLEDIEAAFAREDDAARQSWASGAFSEGISDFWTSKDPAPSPYAQGNPDRRRR
ncbi:enoyl-CoA hydratase/isomerase family protein [Mycolicibacterium arseniciresistens]|jgi:enoyl-CoA hydratase|uniref:Enoyl-CoA hydratase/isomerase family protein n=1 Tax=Mycolicibacterium arseniciresistens TaxID=3062257 RepID=A0ABT8UR10_9MYCO|nr:enoyl-CoA hydratase/isomerase family protein [Mycolicibacterium arseniciresistens]MDO3638624.1 enoyl-CoA hydratase/isomerase family protein [Mycolicibacterium arseniciresistens]